MFVINHSFSLNNSVSLLITGLGADFTRLESFGNVDGFAENLVGYFVTHICAYTFSLHVCMLFTLLASPHPTNPHTHIYSFWQQNIKSSCCCCCCLTWHAFLNVCTHAQIGGLDRSWQRPPGVTAKLVDSKSANGNLRL